MRKLLSLLLILTVNTALSAAPVGVSGQLGSTIYPSIIKVPNNQVTTVSGGALIESGNQNLLINPSFEASNYITGWTYTLGTVSANTTNYVHGKQSLSIVSTSAGVRVYQSVSPSNVAQMAGQQGIVSVKISSTDPLLQVCQQAGGTTATYDINCVTVPVTTTVQPFQLVQIPIIFNATSNGIVIKSATTTTQNIYIDDAFLGVSSIYANLNNDTGYSAQASSAGVLSGLNKAGWISLTSVTDTSLYTYALTGFTVAPNCFASNANNSITEVSVPEIASISSSTLVIRTGYPSAGSNFNKFAIPTSISCEKAGADYANASGSAYVSTNGNFGPLNVGTTTITATTTAPTKGAIVVDKIMATRYGSRLIADYTFQQSSAGSAGSGDYLYALPVVNGVQLQFDSSVTFHAGTNVQAADATAYIGTGRMNDNATAFYTAQLIAYDATHFRAIPSYGTNALFAGSGNVQFSNSNYGLGFHLDIPIADWTNPNLIVGSFAGYASVPEASSPKLFGLMLNGVNCTTSPCTPTNRINTSVLSPTFTRSAVGNYSIPLTGLTQAPACAVSIVPFVSQVNKCQIQGGVSNTSVTVLCFNAAGTTSVDEGFSLNCVGY